MNLQDLCAEFPKDVISWRAQTLTKAGDKAMALAYIDARDVMRRLDEVCGVGGWQCRYPHAGSKTICEIGIKIGDEWVWKSNGAGDTDIEAEKGAISDAFKRAAVLWGVGRYLYDMASPWVPCETYEAGGKKRWSRWTADPWSFIKGHSAPKNDNSRGSYDALSNDIKGCESLTDLNNWWKDPEVQALIKALPGEWQTQIIEEKNAMKSDLEASRNLQTA